MNGTASVEDCAGPIVLTALPRRLRSEKSLRGVWEEAVNNSPDHLRRALLLSHEG
jgi:hypothetical protein